VVGCLLCKYKALSSNPSPIPKKKKQKAESNLIVETSNLVSADKEDMADYSASLLYI
jgi:hypothetical protein